MANRPHPKPDLPVAGRAVRVTSANEDTDIDVPTSQ
jgi:hypothetical protein